MDIAVAPTPSVPDWVRALYDPAPIGVVVCDLAERIVYLNAFQEWNSGVRAEHVLGRLLPDAFARAIDQVRPHYDALRERGQPFSITLRQYNRASDGRPMSFTLSGYRTAGYYFFFPMVQDVLFQAEQHAEELRQEVANTRALLELAEMLATTIRIDEVITTVVRIAPTLLGAARASLFLWDERQDRFVPAASFGLSDEHRARFESLDGRALPLFDELRASGREILLEDPRESPLVPREIVDAFHIGQFLALPIVWRDRFLGALTMDRKAFTPRDVELARGIVRLLGTALANARLVEQAVDAARLKSAFLANMSHEIRTPLNVILGYNQLVADYLEGLGDPSQRPFLDGVTQAGRRLLATIHAVLDMSRIETESFEVHPTPVNVADVAARHVEDLGAIAREKGLSLECRIEAADAIVRCDEYCLTNAIMNLIGNALKFTERGSIVVSVRRDDAANVLLEVVDTGIGIDPEFTPRLFDAFTQERSGYGRTFEGSGLGLALTRRYVEMNGGTISVESRKGEGSTFRIRFPPEIPAA